MTRLPLLLLVLAPLLPGCVAVAAAGIVGVGVVQYERNEVEAEFPADLADVHSAALKALERLEIPAGSHTLSANEGSVVSGDLLLACERAYDGTLVTVRIGTFHSKDHVRRAELVLQEIGTVLEQREELRAWAEKVRATETAPAAEPQG